MVATPGTNNAPTSSLRLGSDEHTASLLEVAAQELLAVTVWYTAAPGQGYRSTVTVRFSGTLKEAKPDEDLGNEAASSRFRQFVCNETFEGVSGAGPVALTARIRDLVPGTWSVRATIVDDDAARSRSRHKPVGAPATDSASLTLTKWSLRPGRRPTRDCRTSSCTVQTSLPPLAVAAGVVPFVWAVAAITGITLGSIAQQLIAARIHPDPGPVLAISLAALAGGVVGAKIWFVVAYRAEHRREGWCVQGFLTGFVIVAGLYLFAGGYPYGAYLTSATPGLLLGLGVGRVGCFFAGCCYGRPTSSRWGIWSSNQRVGTKRIPTQLLESALAFAVAAAVGVAVDRGVSPSGWIFVAAVATYTAVRQVILHLREEPRRSTIGPWATGLTAVAALVVAVAAITL